MSIGGKAVGQMCAEGVEVQLIGGDKHSHAGPAVGARNSDAIDSGLPDAGKRTDRLRYLGCRDIFALPAEGIADTIDEIEIALLVLSHQVASSKPFVSRLEHVAEYLAVGGFLVGIAFEAAGQIIKNFPDRFSGFVRSTANTESLLISNRLTCLAVGLHQRGGESMRDTRRDAADGAGLALDIE